MGGLFGGGGGSGGSTTVVNVPGPTAEETELTKQQIELQKQQIEILKQQRSEQGIAFEFLQKSLDELNKRQAELESDPVLQEITDLQLDLLRRGGRASPEERQLISEATGAASEQGRAAIQEFTQDSLADIRNILAPSRGLRPEDTPVQQAAARVVQEGQRQVGSLEKGLASVRAQAELDFPLARGQFLTETAGFASNLAESARAFQAQLRQQAFQNQLALSGLRQEGALGLLGVQPSGASALASLSSIRAAQTTTTTNSSFNKRPGFFDALSGIGNFAFGIGTAGKVFSSAAFKREVADVTPDEALEMLRRLPLHLWEYKPEFGPGGLHVGPYAEDFKRATGLGDGVTIDLIDAFGLLLGAVRALAAQREAHDGKAA